MFKNYFKSSIRFLRKNKIFTVINLLGLSAALAASFIIFVYVINEFSYNFCHKNRNHIYRILNYYNDYKQVIAGTPYVLAATLKTEFPQVIKAANTMSIGITLLKEGEVFPIQSATAAGSDIFSIFTLKMIYGTSSEDLLDEKNSIVLSKELTDKIFPNENPVGKEILGLINGGENLFIIKGVYENVPENSTFRPICLLSSSWTLDPINSTFKVTNANINWTFNFWNTWIYLAEGTSPKVFEKQFNQFEDKNIGDNSPYSYSLQSLGDVYLHSDNVLNTGLKGNIKNVRLFSLIAILIILVASANYIILSTAVSSSRVKEIAIRKTFGAEIRDIRKQLLSESLLLVISVLPIVLLMALLLLPISGKLFQTKLNIIYTNIPAYVIIYSATVILIGIFSGIYTSSFLSRLKVMDILRSDIHFGKWRQIVRGLLIIIQLVIFCTFVSSTLIIRSQYNYSLKKDLGYSTKDILFIELGNNFKSPSTFINKIQSNPNIVIAGGCMNELPMTFSMTSIYPHFENPELKITVEGFPIGYNFLKTMGIQLVEGRDFSADFGSDLKQSVILNETAVKKLGIINPIGQKLGNYNIIGIMKDFNIHSVRTDIPPLSITMVEKNIRQVAIHYKPGTLNTILPFIRNEWNKEVPDKPLQYSTIESLIINLYSSEKNLSTIVSIFAIFTLLITTLGLFGLILFIGKSRTKEMGIKKVFGSSGTAILIYFLQTYFTLVFISSAISVPLTIYYMNQWLNNFASKTRINWWVFGISFAITTFVILLTVFIHSFKISRTNPVQALRFE